MHTQSNITNIVQKTLISIDYTVSLSKDNIDDNKRLKRTRAKEVRKELSKAGEEE
jgi:hypothetical protein